MGLDGRFAEDQRGGDLGIGQAPGQEPEDLQFPGGEPGQLAGRSRAGWGSADELLDQPAGDRGGEGSEWCCCGMG